MVKSTLLKTRFFKLVLRTSQVFILAILSIPRAHGDAVTLKASGSTDARALAGRVIEGKLVEENDEHIILETFQGQRTIPKERVYKHDRKKVSAFEKYEQEMEKLSGDAKGQIKLAEICEKACGWEKAREHLQKALDLEPDNKTISQTVNNKLKSLGKKEKDWKGKQPKARVATLRVGVKQNISREKIDSTVGDKVVNPKDLQRSPVGLSLGDQARRASLLLNRISKGEIYIAEVIFAVGSTTGDLVYDETFTGTPNGWTNIPMGPENWGPAVIVHEMGHSVFHLGDDDDAAAGGQWGKGKYGPCIMAHNWDAGFCSNCQKTLNVGKFADLLEEEIPEPPLTKITIVESKKEKK